MEVGKEEMRANNGFREKSEEVGPEGERKGEWMIGEELTIGEENCRLPAWMIVLSVCVCVCVRAFGKLPHTSLEEDGSVVRALIPVSQVKTLL